MHLKHLMHLEQQPLVLVKKNVKGLHDSFSMLAAILLRFLTNLASCVYLEQAYYELQNLMLLV